MNCCCSWCAGGLVGLTAREVRDIDEEAFRHDRVRSRFYGEMLVPGEGRYLQHTKVGGRESPELVADDIAEWLVEQMEPGRTYLVGPGSTTAAIMAKLGLANTLLGVDVVRDGELLASDADEALPAGVTGHGPRWRYHCSDRDWRPGPCLRTGQPAVFSRR